MGRSGGAPLALLRASHPEPTVAVTLLSIGLAAASGRDLPGVVAVGAAVVSGQLSIGWSNDYLDAARDASAGRSGKPVAAGIISARIVGIAALVAVVLCVPLSFLSGTLAGAAHLGVVASGWAYNVWFKFTALSVLPYLVAFGLLPAFVVLGLPAHPSPPWWLVCVGALLGGGAHFLNVLPDLDDDTAMGVRGLPHRMGRTGSTAAAYAALLAATVILAARLPHIALTAGALVVVGAVLAAGSVIGRRDGSRAAFRAVLVVVLIDVALFIVSGADLP